MKTLLQIVKIISVSFVLSASSQAALITGIVEGKIGPFISTFAERQNAFNGATFSGSFTVDSTNQIKSSPFQLGLADYTFSLNLTNGDVYHFTNDGEPDDDNFIALPGGELHFLLREDTPDIFDALSPLLFENWGYRWISLVFDLPSSLLLSKDLNQVANDVGTFDTGDLKSGSFVHGVASGGSPIAEASLQLLGSNSTGGSVPVPEPSSIFLGLFGIAFIMICRRNSRSANLNLDKQDIWL